MGVLSRLQTQNGRLIGRCCNHHAFGKRLLAQRLLNESLHLTASLAHQANHHQVGLRKPCKHAKQTALAHARACNKSNTLALAHGKQPVHSLHADIKYFVNGATLHGVHGNA